MDLLVPTIVLLVAPGLVYSQEITLPARLPHFPLNATMGMCPTTQQLQTAIEETRNRAREALLTCGGPTWNQVASLNMTDPNQTCPSGLSQVDSPIRVCQRSAPYVNIVSCSSSTFGVGRLTYSNVCGKIIAYQFGDSIGFYAHFNYPEFRELDAAYLSGISLTHGPTDNREHIWSFAASTNQDTQTDVACPLTTAGTPPFVGNDYFCDSGNPTGVPAREFYTDEDGQGCDADPDLRCQDNNPPWFTKMLSSPTTDDIEMRVCGDQRLLLTNLGIEQIALYVQ